MNVFCKLFSSLLELHIHEFINLDIDNYSVFSNATFYTESIHDFCN